MTIHIGKKYMEVNDYVYIAVIFFLLFVFMYFFPSEPMCGGMWYSNC